MHANSVLEKPRIFSSFSAACCRCDGKLRLGLDLSVLGDVLEGADNDDIVTFKASGPSNTMTLTIESAGVWLLFVLKEKFLLPFFPHVD